ncbi:MAG: metabolite traffic protein EboE [Richelia sp. RM2_1_2]|nr:metabolite traffic protein EboE [Richelia sp. SM1_7_0]NJN07994.1 metabolite traffic protein EboE [Richelia sp. RM1_1_1]NJO28455.1 metabolite traffic protein EboE [Richelia sp. SL_2_1]NJO58051.1 metabolite traffic protein EboE [Richelia sp. RM2_1_2]
MKISPKNLHLTYCTNIHPGEDWSQVFANLQQYIPSLKAKISPNQPFGIGLRIADIASRELLQGNNLEQFKSWLKEHDSYVFTLNGFPYGGFHLQVVKDKVYAPDWSKQERLDYTLRLIQILAELLPDEIEGSISTVPLSYKPWFEGNQLSQAKVIGSATIYIAQVVAQMVRIRAATDKILHLNLEPEPDGLIENAEEVIKYFSRYLLPIGGTYLAKNLGIPQTAAEVLLLEHVRICYDTCHFAVEYENPVTVFEQFQAAGIQIGKIQISAALKAELPQDKSKRILVKERLEPFAESTYLHQVIARYPDGKLQRYRDLATALPFIEETTACEWRTHFHVPLFINDYQVLQSTQDDIVTVFKYLQKKDICNHLEIETYTWEVLPPQMKVDIAASIEREYEWVLWKLQATNSQQLVVSR